MAARRFAIPAVEAKGTLLLEDVGVPLPQIGDLVTASRAIAAEREVMISVIAHAGDGNTHPLIVYDPSDAAMAERAQHGIRRDHGSGDRARRHHHRRARRRQAEKALAGRPDRTEAMELNRRIKDALDPDNILNPGAAI